MKFKALLMDFVDKSHADAIFFFIFSIFLFVYFWKFEFFKIVGILISILGFVVWILGIRTLGKSFQFLPEAKKLVTSGIYSVMRNPVYIGGFLVDFGYLIYMMDAPKLLAVIAFLISIEIIVQLFRIKKEEKVLEKKFGQKYIKYKESTLF